MKKRHACLLAVDEFPSQSYNESLEIAAPVLRSYGVQLLLVSQDIGHVRAVYPNTWETFFSNADAVFWMACDHEETLAYLTKVLGTMTHREQVKGARQPTERERPVMYAEQIKRFLDPARGRVIVTRAGKRPLRLKIAKYYEELPVTAYDPDAAHREKWLRRITRFLVGFFMKRKTKEQQGE